MRDEDQKAIVALIEKMRLAAASPECDRISTDIITCIQMASDPELEWADHPPVILTQGGCAYRAYPITSCAEALRHQP